LHRAYPLMGNFTLQKKHQSDADSSAI
jgi:hypothetical protein